MKSLAVGLILVILGSVAAAAQDKKDDAFQQALFAPELVLKHAREIGLTAQQRRAIMDDIKRTQTELVPLQTDMMEPALDLVELLEQTQVDEAAVLPKVEQVLKIENEVKKRQIALLIRIKNALTREQQARLRVLRDRDAGKNGAADAADGSREGSERRS